MTLERRTCLFFSRKSPLFSLIFHHLLHRDIYLVTYRFTFNKRTMISISSCSPAITSPDVDISSEVNTIKGITVGAHNCHLVWTDGLETPVNYDEIDSQRIVDDVVIISETVHRNALAAIIPINYQQHLLPRRHMLPSCSLLIISTKIEERFAHCAQTGATLYVGYCRWASGINAPGRSATSTALWMLQQQNRAPSTIRPPSLTTMAVMYTLNRLWTIRFDDSAPFSMCSLLCNVNRSLTAREEVPKEREKGNVLREREGMENLLYWSWRYHRVSHCNALTSGHDGHPPLSRWTMRGQTTTI